MSAKENNAESKNYKLVAPEGGWGYMIAVAVVINMTTGTMFLGSIGLLYNDFMNEVGMGSTYTTTMIATYAVCSAISGILTAPLLTKMSKRMLSLLGAILLNVGVFGTIFVTSILPFIICVGALQGAGFGFMYNVSCSILNEYFVKKRLMMISLTQTLVGLATMLAPVFIKWSLDEYGYRGTLLLVSGMTMNNFIAISLIQPVEKHMKKVEVLDSEMNMLFSNDKSNNTLIITINDKEGKELNSNEKIEDLENIKETNKLRKVIDFLFDKSLRTTFLLSCVLLGPSIAYICDMTYSLMLPQALYADNWNQNEVTLAVSLMGFGDLAMRIVFIFCSKWMMKLGSQEVYIIGVGLALAARLGSLWTRSQIANLIYITISGMAHCSIALLAVVVIADAVPPQKFPAAIGIFMLMIGVLNLIISPAIGAVRDLSDSYEVAFYILASCYAIIILFWLIELCYKRNHHKRIQRREYLKQKKLNRR